MTAAKSSPQVSVVDDRLEHIDIADLRIAPWNARKTFDLASMAELSRNLETHGIQVPLTVRPTSGPAYEIVAGHRRFRASLALCEKGNLKFEFLPCIVRKLTDDEACEIGLIDNLQREDVPALEEADAYKELAQRLGTVVAIAQRVGKDVSYVARRLQLVSLSEMPRKALAERLITVDHALLLARLGEEEQNVNLKWALDVNAGIKVPVEKVIETRIADLKGRSRWKWEPQSPARLKEHIEQHVGRKLSCAPWSLDDATLIKDVPACSSCPSNTAHNDTLFGDLNIAAATCENGTCFEMKRVAFVSIKLSDATVKQGDAVQGPAIRLSWKETTVKPRFSEAKAGSVMVDESGVNLLQVFKVGQWVEAKQKSCAHVRLGVTVDWSDAGDRGYMGSGEKKLRKPGQQLTVCIAPGCKVHRKEWEKPKSENRNAPYDAKAEEEKREKLRVAAVAESKIRSNVAFKAIEAIKCMPSEALRKLALEQIPTWGEKAKVANALLPGLQKIMQTAKVDSVEFAKAVAVVSISQHLCAWEHSAATDGRSEFLASVKRLGYDGSGAWKQTGKTETKKQSAKKTVKAKKAAKKKDGRR